MKVLNFVPTVKPHYIRFSSVSKSLPELVNFPAKYWHILLAEVLRKNGIVAKEHLLESVKATE